MNSRHVLYAMLCLAFVPLIGMEQGNGKEKFVNARQLKQSLLAAPSAVEMSDMTSGAAASSAALAVPGAGGDGIFEDDQERDPACCGCAVNWWRGLDPETKQRLKKCALLSTLLGVDITANMLSNQLNLPSIAIGAALFTGETAAEATEDAPLWVRLLAGGAMVAGDFPLTTLVNHASNGYIWPFGLSYGFSTLAKCDEKYKEQRTALNHIPEELATVIYKYTMSSRLKKLTRNGQGVIARHELVDDLTSFVSRNLVIYDRLPAWYRTLFINMCVDQLGSDEKLHALGGMEHDALIALCEKLPPYHANEKELVKAVVTQNDPTLARIYDDLADLEGDFGDIQRALYIEIREPQADQHASNERQKELINKMLRYFKMVTTILRACGELLKPEPARGFLSYSELKLNMLLLAKVESFRGLARELCESEALPVFAQLTKKHMPIVIVCESLLREQHDAAREPITRRLVKHVLPHLTQGQECSEALVDEAIAWCREQLTKNCSMVNFVRALAKHKDPEKIENLSNQDLAILCYLYVPDIFDNPGSDVKKAKAWLNIIANGRDLIVEHRIDLDALERKLRDVELLTQPNYMPDLLPIVPVEGAAAATPEASQRRESTGI